MSSMSSPENFPSPNAIPPRTRSTGLNSGNFPAVKPVLRPVAEANWISPGRKQLLTDSSTTASSYLDPQTLVSSGIAEGDGTSWSPEKEKILLGPYDYMINHPGKDIRKQLIDAFDAWLKVPKDSLVIITRVIGMLHTASLLQVTSYVFPLN